MPYREQRRLPRDSVVTSGEECQQRDQGEPEPPATLSCHGPEFIDHRSNVPRDVDAGNRNGEPTWPAVHDMTF